MMEFLMDYITKKKRTAKMRCMPGFSNKLNLRVGGTHTAFHYQFRTYSSGIR